MTKCSTPVPAIRQSGFITSAIYKTYTLKDLSALSKRVLPHTYSPAEQGDSNHSCTPGSGYDVTGHDLTSDHSCRNHKQRSWEVPALRSAGPHPKVRPKAALPASADADRMVMET